MKKSIPEVPPPVARVLEKLGHDIRLARRRRRIPMALLASRASISRSTLQRVEAGHPGVSLGTYATVLFVLGLHRRIGDLADVKADEVGLDLMEDALPQRVRLPGKGK